jgi:hypothetical protein
LPSTGLRRSTGGGRRDPPFPKCDGGGASDARLSCPQHFTVACHAQARPLPLVPIRVPTTDAAAILFLCHPPLSPARAEPHPPRLVHPGLDLCPPHPCQEFRTLIPMATAMPTTSKASKPRGNRHRRTTGRGPPSPHRHHPCRPGRGRGGEGAEHRTQRPVAPGIVQSISQMVVSLSSSLSLGNRRGGSARGSRLPGAEAAVEEAAAAEMTCFVVGSDVVISSTLCFWFGGNEKYWT